MPIHLKKVYIFVFILFDILLISFIIFELVQLRTNNKPVSRNDNTSTETPKPTVVEQAAITGQTLKIMTPEEIDVTTLPADLPSFVKITGTDITFSPTKYQKGDYKFILSTIAGEELEYHLTVDLPPLDTKKLEADLRKYFGKDINNYGIYVHDLLREKTVSINGSKIFQPASIAKMPVAVLVMRDIDAKKYSLSTTYPLKNSEKFSTTGFLGEKPNGTKITMETYLDRMLRYSDNNAWYALVHFLGNSYQVVNPRIIKELGVNPLFLDPPQGEANKVGKVMSDIYSAKTLSRKSADYIIDKLEHAVPSMREGVGLGVPKGTKFANKIGTLSDGSNVSYQDAAIIWGKETDYVLVVMDKHLEWIPGVKKLTEISQIVYKDLNP